MDRRLGITFNFPTILNQYWLYYKQLYNNYIIFIFIYINLYINTIKHLTLFIVKNSKFYSRVHYIFIILHI